MAPGHQFSLTPTISRKWFDWFWSNFIKEVPTQIGRIDLYFTQILATRLALPIKLSRKHYNRSNVLGMSASAYTPKEHDRSTTMIHAFLSEKKTILEDFIYLNSKFGSSTSIRIIFLERHQYSLNQARPSFLMVQETSIKIWSACGQNKIQNTKWWMYTIIICTILPVYLSIHYV
jgi:hypothetical protein